MDDALCVIIYEIVNICHDLDIDIKMIFYGEAYWNFG